MTGVTDAWVGEISLCMLYLASGMGGRSRAVEAPRGLSLDDAFMGRRLGGVGNGGRRKREHADGRRRFWPDGDWREPGEPFAAAMREFGGERAPLAEHAEQMSCARDEIAFCAQAAAQPNAGDSAKRCARGFRWSAAHGALSRRQQVCGADDDEVARRVFDLLEAHFAIAAPMARSDATAREPCEQRQQPQG